VVFVSSEESVVGFCSFSIGIGVSVLIIDGGISGVSILGVGRMICGLGIDSLIVLVGEFVIVVGLIASLLTRFVVDA
jgi:hypothetical protein